MRIINLTREVAQLQFSIDELLIIKNSLIEVYYQFSDFKALIRGISKNECLPFAITIGEIIDCSQKKNGFNLKSPFIESIALSEGEFIIHLAYERLLGIGGILCEVCYGCIKDFQSKTGFDRATVSYLLDSINDDVIHKMEEGRPETLIFNRGREISRKLNFSNLEIKPFSPEIRKICVLKFNSHTVEFFLVCQSRSKRFSRIMITISQTSHQADLLVKSNVQGVEYRDLIRLVSYLELVVTSVISDADLEKTTLSLRNSNWSNLLDIKVFSRCLESQSLNIRFRLYLNIHKDSVDNKYWDIEDISNISNIYAFTSSVREFLSQLPKKEIVADSVGDDVIDKMEEDIPRVIINEKALEISRSLNLTTTNLKLNSSPPQVRRLARLPFNSHVVEFFLGNESNRKTYCRYCLMMINISKTSYKIDSLAQCSTQRIEDFQLVRLVAYLELVSEFVISDADLEKFTLSLNENHHLLEIHAFSRCLESNSLNIRLRLYLNNCKDNLDNEYWDIEDTLSISNIYPFTSSIREFLSQLPKKEIVTDSLIVDG